MDIVMTPGANAIRLCVKNDGKEGMALAMLMKPTATAAPGKAALHPVFFRKDSKLTPGAHGMLQVLEGGRLTMTAPPSFLSTISAPFLCASSRIFPNAL